MLILFVAATIPSLVFGLGQLRLLREASQTAREEQHHRAQRLAQEIHQYVTLHSRAVRTLTRQLETVADPTQLNLQAILDRMREQYPGIVGTFMGDAEGNALVFSPPTDPTGRVLSGENYADAWYFEPLRRTKKMVFSPVIPGVVIEMRPLITMVCPILGPDGELRYYISGGLDLGKVAEFLRQHQMDQGEIILLVDSEDKLIAHVGLTQSAPFESFKSSPHVWRIRNGTGWQDDGEVVAGYATVPDLGWGVAVITPVSTLEADWRRTLGSSVATVALGLVLGWLMAWLMARTMNAPIAALMTAAQAVSVGNLAVRVPTTHLPLPREFAELHQQFNLMISSLQGYQEELLQWNTTLEKRVKERTRELATLNETAVAVSGMLDLDALMQQVAAGIVDLAGAEIGVVVLRQADGQSIIVGVHTGGIPWDPPTAEQLRSGMSTQIMEQGEPIILGEVITRRDDFGHWVEQYPHASFCGVPIRTSGKVVGVLATIHRESDRFSEQTASLLATLAGQVGPTVTAASLFREVQEQRNTLLSLTNSMTEGLLVVDAHDRVRFSNEAASRLLQLNDPPVLGAPLADWFARWNHGQAGATLNLTPGAYLQQGRSVFDLELPGPPRRTVAATLFPVLGDGPIYLGYGILLRDVTQERKLERDKDELIANVSHELRTPLTSILGNATTLLNLEAFLEPEERLAFMQGIVEESNRLKELIESLLDMARINTDNLDLELKPVNWAETCVRAVRHAQTRWPDHHFGLELQEGLPAVRGDAARLEQVLDNLLTNAARYSEAGTQILVSAEPCSRGVRTSVIDQGIGIPAEDLDHIFDRFYRGESPSVRRVRGTGLGLAICRGIVESHRGQIWVERNPDQGSTFHFIIPTMKRRRGP